MYTEDRKSRIIEEFYKDTKIQQTEDNKQHLKML